MCYREFCVVLIFNLNVVQTAALTEVILCQHTFLCELNLSPHRKFWWDLFSIKLPIGTNYATILYFFSIFVLHQLFCDFAENRSSSKQTIITWVISSTLYKICYNRQLQFFFLAIMFHKYSLSSPCRMESTVLEKDSGCRPWNSLPDTGQNICNIYAKAEYHLLFLWQGTYWWCYWKGYNLLKLLSAPLSCSISQIISFSGTFSKPLS